MGFLLESGLDILEADAEGEGAEGGEGAPQAKEDKQLAGMMPKAMDATLDAFNGFKSVKAMPEKMQKMFNEITKKVSDHVQDPDTPEALSDFKTAEELHALIVMSVDRYAVAAQAKIKAGQKASDVKFTDIFQKAIKDSQAVISNKISKLPFLQRAIEKFKEGRKGLEDRLSGLYSDWRTAILSIGEDPEKALAIATDKNFAGQRDIQGTVVSNPKIDPAIAKKAGEQTTQDKDSGKETGTKFDEKLVNTIVDRGDELEQYFQQAKADKNITEVTYDIASDLIVKLSEADPEDRESVISNFGPNAKRIFDSILKSAADGFPDLEQIAAQKKRYTDYKKKDFSAIKSRVKDLRAAYEFKVKNGEISGADGDLIDVFLEKVEKSDDPSNIKIGIKTEKAGALDIMNDAKNDFEDLEATLKAMKRASPKFEVDFGIPVEKLEELVRNFIDAPADKSQSAIQNEFISGLEEAGSDEKTYSAAFAKADKYGGIDNPKALKAMGLEKLANEKEGAAGEEGSPELAGKTLSSVLFNTDASVKKKLDPVGEKVKSSLVSLKAALDSYTANKGGKKNRAALLSAIKDSQDSLKGVKLESTQSKDNVLIERWQKLAGII